MSGGRASVARRALAIGPFVVVVILLGALGLVAVDILSALRAFVEGESLWSKGQKDAAYHLQRYADLGIESEFAAYLDSLRAPRAFHQARVSLDAVPPDPAAARQAFVDGGLNESDVGAMVRLYLNFRHQRYMADAIGNWTGGDLGIESLDALAVEVHRKIAAGERDDQLRDLLERIPAVDAQLTVLEQQFSSRIGDAARAAQGALIAATLLLTPLLAAAAGWFAVQSLRRQQRVEDALIDRESAERANRSKTEFLSRVSHELRTPLNAILGFAELLEVDKSPPLAPRHHPWVEHILRSGRYLLALVDDLLDLSRIEDGSLKLTIVPVELGAAVAAGVDLVETIAAGRGISLVNDVTTGVIGVRADRLRLEQVVVNLLSNAIKYNAAQGAVRIGYRLAGDRVVLEISDTGIGMTAAQVEQAFEPFNRAGAETSGIEGSGLGLTIVRRLVGQMGGTIAVQSEPGHGSTFSVTLPRAELPPA